LNSTIHNLTLQGITGIIFGAFSILYIWILQLLLDDFSAGIGIGMLPISFLEIILTAISVFFILISYIFIVITNKKRRKKLGLKGWETTSKKNRRIYFILLILCVDIL
jgi:predicted neutral ceramidase superfamily lipid hydrolase